MDVWYKETPRVTPDDHIIYTIHEEVISFTEKVLKEYGDLIPSAEGLVYWAGLKQEDNVTISTCIAPKIKASRYNIGIDHLSNFRVVETLSANKIIHVAQVHSHPGTWVDHSETDNEYASFKVNGLLSLVVPNFCENGMVPLTSCGVHRFATGEFLRVTNKYIKAHFKIIQSPAHLIDLRYE